MHTSLRRRLWRACTAFAVTSTSFVIMSGSIAHAPDTEARRDPSGASTRGVTPTVSNLKVADELESAEPPSTCAPPEAAPVPDMVGSIFRCRLNEEGLAREEVRQITAEALVVAQCESEFDANAVVFDGRYRESPHPATGAFYSAAGVFQFIRVRADRWIAGGYANVTDPVANIDAAARLYLHNMRRGYPGWSDWACAAANDGFQATSVLPGWPGGPSRLPDWAFAV